MQPCCALAALVASPIGALTDLHRGRGRLGAGIMPHLVDKRVVERANTVLLLGILWGALAACVIGAMVYDVVYFVKGW